MRGRIRIRPSLVRSLTAALLIGAACSSTPSADAGSSDSGIDATADTGVCCMDGANQSLTPPEGALGFAWTAWRHVPACSMSATALEIPSNGPAIAILADANGLPGAILLPETVAKVTGVKRVKASFPPIQLEAGKPVWLALKNMYPGNITLGSQAPFAMSGATTKATVASALSGPWDTVLQDKHAIYLLTACP